MGLEYNSVVHYGFGYLRKVRYRGIHNCYKCNKILSIEKHERIVSRKSEEAKFYTFNLFFTHAPGPCKFVHDVFYCSNCLEYIEFRTQLTYEDINIFISKVKRKFKKGINLQVRKCFETKEGKLVDRITSIEDIQKLCLLFWKDNKIIYDYRSPILREKEFERPYYFKFSKRQIMKNLKTKLKNKN